jgi:hypothetical protein
MEPQGSNGNVCLVAGRVIRKHAAASKLEVTCRKRPVAGRRLRNAHVGRPRIARKLSKCTGQLGVCRRRHHGEAGNRAHAGEVL